MRPESAASLLATPRRQKLLEHIWQRTSLSRRQFATLYLAPLERYAELVQQFPASENHHHAYPGGMLDHGLEIVAYALKLRQSYLLPAGVTPEAQAAQAEAWTAGTAYAALLHDIGKIAVDLHVEHADGSVWHPWHGPLRKPYRFRYRKEREYRLHSAATGLLYARLLDRDIFDWLSGYPDLWAALLYVLAGQYEHAGTLGELVVQADQASVAQELGGDPSKALVAPKPVSRAADCAAKSSGRRLRKVSRLASFQRSAGSCAACWHCTSDQSGSARASPLRNCLCAVLSRCGSSRRILARASSSVSREQSTSVMPTKARSYSPAMSLSLPNSTSWGGRLWPAR